MDIGVEFTVTKYLSKRWFLEVLDSPTGAVIMAVAQPLVWYFLFGSMLEKITDLPDFPTKDYGAFILPGIVVLISLNYLTMGGMCIVEDFRQGFLQKMWAAPISKTSVVFGRVIVMATLNMIQTAFLLLIAVMDGVEIATGILGAALIVLISGVFTAAVTSISLAIAYGLKYEFTFNAITSFAILPIMFVSNAFVPVSLMPSWLAKIAEKNPASITIDGMRSLVIDGWATDTLMPALLFLSSFFILSVMLAVASFQMKVEGDRVSLSSLACKLTPKKGKSQ